MNLTIRRANINDLSNLAVLKQQVWISTYATQGITNEFSNYVLSEYSLNNVRETIADKNRIILIASINDCVIGCAEILLSSECPVSLGAASAEILTLYVLERFHGLGIGKKLLDECIEEFKRHNLAIVWLTVYYKNQNAFRFYIKHKFKKVGHTYFSLGNNKHKNYVMVKEII